MTENEKVVVELLKNLDSFLRVEVDPRSSQRVFQQRTALLADIKYTLAALTATPEPAKPCGWCNDTGRQIIGHWEGPCPARCPARREDAPAPQGERP